ncbi:MAG: hydrogenase nickel incorporation protein HypB [Calditrichaeota bacterium]|nr:hydrogenase nickel incorporation protein HypB [Calditrichota bacterium]
MKVLTVERKILKKNDDIAAENRQRFKQANLTVLNLLSSPGAGKTTLLERTLEKLANRYRVAVVEGDVQTDNDARRIAKHHVPVVQVVTRGGCHLEANLVQEAVANFELDALDLLFIENVGNLVCPANYDLGENLKVVIISTTEGDDKPLKYPPMFRVAHVCVINKIDLLPYVDFDIQKARDYARGINPDLRFFELSARTGEGLEDWIRWLESLIPKSTA